VGRDENDRIIVNDRVPNEEMIERLGIDNIVSVLQQNRLRWYRLVLRKEDNDWVKKFMEYEMEGSRPEVYQRGLEVRLCKNNVKLIIEQEGCHASK